MGWKSTVQVSRKDALENIYRSLENLPNWRLADILEIVSESGESRDYDIGANFIVGGETEEMWKEKNGGG